MNLKQTALSAAAALVAVAANLSVGCSSSQLPMYPVEGCIHVDGRPAEMAYVVFHPVGGDETLKPLRPRGVAGPDGRFALMTLWRDDGAPAADYRVTVVWPGTPPEGGRDEFHPDELASRPDVLRGRYGDPASTPLRVTIVPGKNQLPTFELETPREQ